MPFTKSEVSPAEHSMCAAECNLADDASWKKIQKNTFTRWCNEHLKCVLSHKKMFRKYHTRPTFRQMRLDNVSVALKLLDQENVKLVSIDSKAIMDGNMKLILGLVWTLILHYSISSHLLEDGGQDKTKKQTPELRLLGWIQDNVPELSITNFSQDWQNGKALGALVDGLAPSLCPDWESWDKVIAPEEIIDPRVDEQSIMTYLSMFPKAQLKSEASLKPKSGLQPKGVRVGQVADFKVDTSRAGPVELEVHIKGPAPLRLTLVPKRAPSSSGRGVLVWRGHGGNGLSKARFECDDQDDGLCDVRFWPTEPGKYAVHVTCDEDEIEDNPFMSHISPNKNKCYPHKASASLQLLGPFGIDEVPVNVEVVRKELGLYTCYYTPTTLAKHTICVTWGGVSVPGSPFRVSKMELVEVTDNGDGTFSVAYSPSNGGPSLSSGVCAKIPQTFTIDYSKTGEVPEAVAVMTTSGKMELVEVTDNGDGTYSVAYSPSMEGPHSLVVKYADENEFSRLQTMTWTQDVMGSSPNGSKKLLTEMASLRAPADVTDNRDGTVTLMYDPTEEGLHQMHIKVDGTALPESPLQFYVNNASNSDTMAHGAGLVYGMTNKIATFTIFNKDSTHCKLDISLEGPSKAEIRLMNNTVSGDYSILVRHNNEHITGSPFTARIAMAGEGVVPRRSRRVMLGTATDFSLDIIEEDISLLTASIMFPSGLDVSCLLKRQPDRHIGQGSGVEGTGD
ncbi:unnamed protein product [Coregonus sp. 'balchen']|nr:unnamed protein product [Coregonus sp. 'balchen']